MATISLSGPDGAGKTTISQRLLACKELRLKYLYMGVNLEATNLALPTSALARLLKRREEKRKEALSDTTLFLSRRTKEGRSWRRLRSTARVALFIVEEWYRQLLALLFQFGGYTVLFDRHFLIDFSLDESAQDRASPARRFHRWTLTRFYPSPGLVIFLDAPGQVLFDRKGEKSPEELERRRQSFLALAPRFPRWVNIDATQPLDTVYRQVYKTIQEFVSQSR